MEIKEMNIEQVLERRGAINTEVNDDSLTIERIAELETEVTELNKREAEIKEARAQRQAVLDRVTNATDDSTEFRRLDLFNKGDNNMSEITYNSQSPEYRNAYWKSLAGEKLTEVEERAFTHTTATSAGVVLAKTDVDQIFSLIQANHPILNDITVYRTGTVLELTKHTAIAAGDAKSVAEGVANDDEENTFVKVTLSGKDFSKHVEVSYALGKMNAVNLSQYLIGEIADRLGSAIAKDIYATVVAGMAVGNKLTSAAVKVTTYKELISVFALLGNAKATDIYVNNSTLYNYIVSLADLQGRPLFQPNMQDGVQGYLLGARVKLEDSVADHVILIGEPKQVVGNFVQEPIIEADKDIKRHVDIYAGYARFESALMNDKAFASLTVKQV